MKKILAPALAWLMLLSCAACGNAVEAPMNTSEPSPQITAEPAPSAGKSAPCTAEEIAATIEAGALAFNGAACEYLIRRQDRLPADVLACLNEHIGEYRVYRLSGADGELAADEAELTDAERLTIAAILQLHGLTPAMLLEGEALTSEELSERVAANARYTVNASTYPKPEDGDRFLPFFQNGDAEVLAEALGVTVTAPREVTYATFSEGVGISICAKITNTSDRRVQLMPANDMSESEWRGVAGYDPALVINWGEAEGTDIIPLSAARVLEPGESTVQRYTYVGKSYEDYEFISRFSWRVTDGESTELLAAVVKARFAPSDAAIGSCTVSGTVYDSETGLPAPFIDVQSSRNENDYATTDVNGRFTLEVPAFRSDATGNWARATIFVNEIGVGGNKPNVSPDYAEESIIIEPKDGESCELTLALKPKPAQVSYTVTGEHEMGMQAYGFDTSSDIVAVTPFHTDFSEQYRFENGYIHVFDGEGRLLFEKPVYGEERSCDVSRDGTLVAAVVHSSSLGSGEADTATVWDISGSEAFSFNVPYRANEALYVREAAPRDGYFRNLHDVELSPDNKLLAIATDEGYVCVVRLADGEIVRDFYMKSGNNHKLFFSLDGSTLYTASDCGDLRATNILTGEVLWSKYIESMIIDFALTDTFVITSSKATGTGYLICTELSTGKTLWTLDVGMRCSKLSLSHDGNTLFWGTDTAGTNERAMLIDTRTGTPLWATISGKQAAAFSADDMYVAMRSGGDLTLRTVTGEHLYGAIIAPDGGSLSWGLYMSGDCKHIVSFAGGRMDKRFYGTMYALTLDENTPIG